jgi:hypothetical protein
VSVHGRRPLRLPTPSTRRSGMGPGRGCGSLANAHLSPSRARARLTRVPPPPRACHDVGAASAAHCGAHRGESRRPRRNGLNSRSAPSVGARGAPQGLRRGARCHRAPSTVAASRSLQDRDAVGPLWGRDVRESCRLATDERYGCTNERARTPRFSASNSPTVAPRDAISDIRCAELRAVFGRCAKLSKPGRGVS